MSNLIPEGWQLAPITEFASLKHGHQFRTPDFSETGVRVIKIGQVVGGGKVSLKNCDFVRSDVYEETKGFELKGGEILMSLTGNIGRVGIVPYVPYPLLQNYRVGLFSPTNGKCDKEYLAQILGSELVTQQLIDKSNVTAQANFGKADLEQVIVQMPPLPEQQKIASILSSVDDVIEKTRAQIDKLKDLKTGMMQELLTKGIGHTEFKDSPMGRIPAKWDVKFLPDISENHDSKRVPIKSVDRSNMKGGYRYYGASGIIDYVNDYIYDGTYILLGEDGENVLSRNLPLAFIVNGKFWVNNHAHVLKANPNTDINFLCEYLESIDYANIASGSAQPKITQTSLNSIQVPVPPLAEQKVIAAILKSVDDKIEFTDKKLSQLRLSKKALMQDLLTGKVRVKLTDKESAAR